VPDLSSDIAEQVLEPIASAADGQSATGRSVEELIKADQYLAGKTAAAKRRRGMMFSVFRTPGAAGGCVQINSFDRPCGGC
jgi:hypothetical protein